MHFVWQGAAIALGAWLVMRWTGASARVRYAAGVAALAMMVAAPVATWAVLAERSAASPAASAPPAPSFGSIVGGIDGAERSSIVGRAPETAGFRVPDVQAFVLLWMIGVAVCSVRLGGGWVVARRMASASVKPAAPELEAIGRRMAVRLGVRKAVRLLESSSLAVPVVVGWLKPAIVLPVAALAQLTPAQVEALIAHELAHVRRHDYLVNLLQSAAEVLLFYHPAVWWLSRRVRVERELCCDDATVAVCDRVAYASALGALASLLRPQVALAATDGPLARRVRRILGGCDHASAGSAWLPGVMLALGLSVAAPAAMWTSGDDVSADAVAPAHAAIPNGLDAAAPPTEQEAALVIEAARVTIVEGGVRVENGSVHLVEAQSAQSQAEQERLRAIRAIEEQRARQAQEMKALVERLREIQERQALAQAVREAQLKSAEQQRQRMEEVAAAQAAGSRLNARELHELLYELLAGRRTAIARDEAISHLQTLDAPATNIVAGDVLQIRISGEPDLPTMYQIREDGTIRVPLLAAVRVTGQTLDQVRQALQRQLNGRPGSPKAEVSVLRRRQ